MGYDPMATPPDYRKQKTPDVPPPYKRSGSDPWATHRHAPNRCHRGRLSRPRTLPHRMSGQPYRPTCPTAPWCVWMARSLALCGMALFSFRVVAA